MGVVGLAALLAAPPAASWAQSPHEAFYRTFDAAVRRNHLVGRPDCLAYEDVYDLWPRFEVDVHERHDAECPGDRETEPRLFTLRLDRRTGRVFQSDPDDPDAFKPLR